MVQSYMDRWNAQSAPAVAGLDLGLRISFTRRYMRAGGFYRDDPSPRDSSLVSLTPHALHHPLDCYPSDRDSDFVPRAAFFAVAATWSSKESDVDGDGPSHVRQRLGPRHIL